MILPRVGLALALGSAFSLTHRASAVMPQTPAALLQPEITYEGCVDFRGIPVVSVRDESVANVAVAEIAPDGTPVIRYNPTVLASFQAETRLFWYAHECGHHALGHAVRNLPLVREKEADCWAVRTLVEAGLVTDSDLDVIMRDISRLAGDGWVYLPGPQRAMLLDACSQDGQDDDGGHGDGGDSGEGNQGCVPVHTDCEHPVHARGDLVPCTHPAHRADVVPCGHVCFNPYYGAVACHQADTVPCTHPAHSGHTVPCIHTAHPEGHDRCV